MADSYRAAIDVVFFGIDVERVATIQTLARKRLVQFDEVEVVDRHVVALQKARDRKDGSDSHLVGLAARNGPTHETSHRLKALTLCSFGFHDHDGRGTVRKLRRIAGGNVFTWAPDRLQLREAPQRCVRTISLVSIDGVVANRFFFRFLIALLHFVLHAHTFPPDLPPLLARGPTP